MRLTSKIIRAILFNRKDVELPFERFDLICKDLLKAEKTLESVHEIHRAKQLFQQRYLDESNANESEMNAIRSQCEHPVTTDYTDILGFAARKCDICGKNL